MSSSESDDELATPPPPPMSPPLAVPSSPPSSPPPPRSSPPVAADAPSGPAPADALVPQTDEQALAALAVLGDWGEPLDQRAAAAMALTSWLRPKQQSHREATRAKQLLVDNGVIETVEPVLDDTMPELMAAGLLVLNALAINSAHFSTLVDSVAGDLSLELVLRLTPVYEADPNDQNLEVLRPAMMLSFALLKLPSMRKRYVVRGILELNASRIAHITGPESLTSFVYGAIAATSKLCLYDDSREAVLDAGVEPVLLDCLRLLGDDCPPDVMLALIYLEAARDDDDDDDDENGDGDEEGQRQEGENAGEAPATPTAADRAARHTSTIKASSALGVPPSPGALRSPSPLTGRVTPGIMRRKKAHHRRFEGMPCSATWVAKRLEGALTAMGLYNPDNPTAATATGFTSEFSLKGTTLTLSSPSSTDSFTPVIKPPTTSSSSSSTAPAPAPARASLSSGRQRFWSLHELCGAATGLARLMPDACLYVGMLPFLTLVLQLTPGVSDRDPDEITAAQRSAIVAAWHLSFAKTGKEAMPKDKALVSTLRALAAAEDHPLRSKAAGVLFELRLHKSCKGGACLRGGPQADASKPAGLDSDSDATATIPSVQVTGTDDQQPDSPTAPLPAAGGQHIMLSYCWSDQTFVLKLKNHLRQRGFRTWMDVDEMSGSTLEAMADAVERAAVVIVCLSPEYKDSAACRTEAEYAYQQKKPIIPVKPKRYAPKGWLGALLGTRLYYQMDEHDQGEFTAKMDALCKELNKFDFGSPDEAAGGTSSAGDAASGREEIRRLREKLARAEHEIVQLRRRQTAAEGEAVAATLAQSPAPSPPPPPPPFPMGELTKMLQGVQDAVCARLDGFEAQLSTIDRRLAYLEECVQPIDDDGATSDASGYV